jgi:arylsulfatase
VLSYFAQNTLADFIFMAAVTAVVAGAAALVRRISGKGGRPGPAWPTAVAAVSLAYLICLEPVNFYYIGRNARFLSAQSLLLNAALFSAFAVAVYPAAKLLAVYFRHLAAWGVFRTLQVAAAAAVALSALVLFAPGGLAAEASAAPPPRPNVALIVVDTLRADALSCYGAPLPTPNLDRFAARACRFENAYSCAPQTNRSVMTIFTSQYPTVHKARIDAAPGGDWITLAEALSREGYYCRAIIGNDVLRPALGFNRGFDDYHMVTEPDAFPAFHDTVFNSIYGASVRLLANRPGEERITDLVTRETVDFLDSYEGDRPFFLYAHYLDPHMPYTPPAEFVRGTPELRRRALEKLTRDVEDGYSYEFTEVDVLRALYLGEVAYVDDRLGDVFAAFEGRGLFENTLVIVTADHGEMFREHGFLGHDTHYREVIRVPLLVRAPAGPLASCRWYGGAVSLADLAPTVYAHTGVSAPSDLEGKALGALVAASAGERFVYSETRTFADEPAALHSARFTIIDDREKGRIEFYDREDDPDERLNRYRFDDADDLLGELRRKRLAVAEKAGECAAPATVKLTEEEIFRLKSLAYVKD